MDVRILGFTATLALITGLLLGLAPAFSVLRVGPQRAIKEGENQATASRARLSAGKLLVSLQVASSLVLLFAAGLFIRTLQNLKSINPGIRTHGVLTMMVEPLDAEYLASFGPPALLRSKNQRLTNLWAQVVGQIRATPGVQSASLSVLTPLSGRDRGVAVDVPGFKPRSDRDKGIGQNHVSDGYFETSGHS